MLYRILTERQPSICHGLRDLLLRFFCPFLTLDSLQGPLYGQVRVYVYMHTISCINDAYNEESSYELTFLAAAIFFFVSSLHVSPEFIC